MRPRLSGILSLVAMAGAVSAALGASQARATGDPEDTLDRLGRYVEQYYSRAQSVMAQETVLLQPLQSDMSFNGFPRRLVYELRVEWNPDPDGGPPSATVARQLISVGGRPPRPGDEPGCMDPRPVSPEPLAMLLPGRQERFRFTPAGVGRVDRRTAMILDYAPRTVDPPKVEWRDECASVDLPGHTRGRVWLDPLTAAVLRLDERVSGLVEIPVPPKLLRRGGPAFMTIERAETSIQYRAVTFTDPDETILLPAQIDSFTVIRNSGSPRMRTTQTFTNYRRFLTDSRVVQ